MHLYVYTPDVDMDLQFLQGHTPTMHAQHCIFGSIQFGAQSPAARVHCTARWDIQTKQCLNVHMERNEPLHIASKLGHTPDNRIVFLRRWMSSKVT